MSDYYVNPLSKPQSAGPNDTRVGTNEFGQPLYQTVTGQRYSVAPSEDQRTPRQKIEDLLESSWDYFNNPVLPSKQQVAEFAKDTALGAYQSVHEATRGEGTLGNAVGMAPVMGAASIPFEAPEDAVRIFGGRTARSQLNDYSDDSPYWKAVDLLESGADHRQVWEETGWYFDPTERRMKFEISDKDFRFNYEPDEEFDDLMGDIILGARLTNDNQLADPNFGWKIDAIVDHPKLFEEYPELLDYKIVFDNSSNSYGWAIPEVKKIGITARVIEQYGEEGTLSTILHELQHAVQDIEGFSSGTSREGVLKENPQLRADYSAAKRDYSRALYEYDNFKISDEEFDRIKDRYVNLHNRIFTHYQANPGETEARMAEVRRYLTDLERQEEFPGDTRKRVLSEAGQKLLNDLINSWN